MLGIMILTVLTGMEIGLLLFCLRTKSDQIKWKIRFRGEAFMGLILLALVQVIQFGFRWYLIFVYMMVQMAMAIVYFWSLSKKEGVRKEKAFHPRKAVAGTTLRTMALVFFLLPAILFPQFDSLATTGEYPVARESITLEDTNRMENYDDEKQSRKITIEFWYPETGKKDEKFPLLVFSHGAFGYRGSNYSTFAELAGNGYIVCSIDHTYQSFFTKQTDGKVTTVNPDFLKQAMAVEAEELPAEEIFALTHEWLELRTGDMNLVLDTIMEKADETEGKDVYGKIEVESIGLFGHSLGGATAAETGRTREDIDAVIVLDGTMIGESVAFENGKEILRDTPYPVPILNIYNEKHYQDALKNEDKYANMVIMEKAVDAKQTVFIGSGHLNFTDLPVFSPIIANALGTGTIDPFYCIETTNQILLSYFNHYLKGTEELKLLEEYRE